jgi:ADP-ribose pyrophosphatase YjhB (NUDIX family)
MHKSAGVIIKNQEGKILMLNRANFPFGWACPAGHVEENETPEDAAVREVFEESNLNIKKHKLLTREIVEWNDCKRGGKGHDWFLFETSTWKGELKNNGESKAIGWFSIKEIKKMELEEVWKYWFEKYNII